MTKQQAYAYIRRQFYREVASKEGINTVFQTMKRTSWIAFMNAVKVVGGNIIHKCDSYTVRARKTNVVLYTCECFIPDDKEPALDIFVEGKM